MKMKRMVGAVRVCALLVGLISPAAQAAATAEVSTVLGPLSVSDGVTVLGTWDEAYGIVQVDGVTADEAYDAGTVPITVTANTSQGSATGYSEAYYAMAAASAAPAPDTHVRSYAYAWPALYFEVNAGGTVTFDAAYAISTMLSTEYVGEYAGGSGVVGLRLFDADLNLVDEDSADLYSYVDNGNSGDSSDTCGLSVSGGFEQGTNGSVELWADAEACSYSIPAPGAVLLGTMGAGLVGWLRRRRGI